jgi:three-Cys-motif partner protein
VTRSPHGALTGQSPFFRQQRPAAVLKHGILRRYLRVFASKTGSTARDRRVAYLDGYSGPGEYQDGTPGSPMLAAQTAQVLGNIRNLEGFYVEKQALEYRQLREVLAQTDHRHRTYQGFVQDHLPAIMDAVGSAPLFAFFDPFGLGVPFDMLTERILARKQGPIGPATEVLLNFSLPGLRRNAGHLTSTATNPRYLKARATTIERVDRTLGGDWWQSIWQTGSKKRQADIVTGYADRLRAAAGGWGRAIIPVRNRWDGPPAYCLIFLTSYQGGLWAFNEALSNAMEEYRQFAHQFHGMLDLHPLPNRKVRWIDQLTSNITAHLTEHGAFSISQDMTAVYGDTIGFARATHVRQAVARLCQQGKIHTEVREGGRLIKTCGQGSVELMKVLPAG